jgi:F-box-like
MLTSLERELLDWQVDLALTEASVAELQTCSSNMKPILSEIKQLLSPIRSVPDEIWLQIFQLVHEENLSQRPPLLRPSYILHLSQVCRKWRAVTLTPPKLWNSIAVVPLLWWTVPEQTAILNAVERSSGNPIELFVRLWLMRTWESQALASAKRGRLYINARESNPYARLSPESGYTGTSRADLSQIDASLIPGPYSLHLHTQSDVRATEKIPENLPFRIPQSLTIQATVPRASAQLREMTSSFKEVRKFVLVDIWPTSVITAPIDLPNLIYLHLDLRSFKSFSILPLLFPTLEELHVRHDGTGSFQDLAIAVPLPKLHTISVTLHDYKLCTQLITPMLQTLILHSSSPLVEPAKALQHLELGGQYARVTNVIFHSWSHIGIGPSALDITKVLFMRSTQLSRLTFNSCHVDGATLLALLREPIQKRDESSCGVSIIKEVTISSCAGITQTDCEGTKSQVQKLIVYV